MLDSYVLSQGMSLLVELPCIVEIPCLVEMSCVKKICPLTKFSRMEVEVNDATK